MSYVVWGRMCLIFHGVPRCMEELSFVFPDAEVHRAHAILARRPDCFTQCRCHTDRRQIEAWEHTAGDALLERRKYHHARDAVLGDMLRRIQAREANYSVVEELHARLFPACAECRCVSAEEAVDDSYYTIGSIPWFPTADLGARARRTQTTP
ncbi:hypothetical protein DENSPDRAFT_190606 [Dentipellis sp. KUC8613]|nr:hypothetical protein DENSPDRAFT_190606 [Dentipellis sp. KUC8613]